MKGYSLIEVLITIVLIGVLAAVATAALIRPGAGLSSAAEMIAADLRELKYLAMAEGSPVIVTFTPAGYRVHRDGSEIIDTRFPRDLNSFQVGIANPHRVVFDTFGEPVSGETVIIVQSSQDGSRQRILIEKYTGFSRRE